MNNLGDGCNNSIQMQSKYNRRTNFRLPTSPSCEALLRLLGRGIFGWLWFLNGLFGFWLHRLHGFGAQIAYGLYAQLADAVNGDEDVRYVIARKIAAELCH